MAAVPQTWKRGNAASAGNIAQASRMDKCAFGSRVQRRGRPQCQLDCQKVVIGDCLLLGMLIGGLAGGTVPKPVISPR